MLSAVINNVHLQRYFFDKFKIPCLVLKVLQTIYICTICNYKPLGFEAVASCMCCNWAEMQPLHVTWHMSEVNAANYYYRNVKHFNLSGFWLESSWQTFLHHFFLLFCLVD